MAEGNQWYYFSRRTQNRSTNNGYWKTLGIDEPIMSSGGKRVGMKKYMVFYIGEAPSGIKSSWIMQEYRLSDSGSSSSSGRSSSKRRGHSKIVTTIFFFSFLFLFFLRVSNFDFFFFGYIFIFRIIVNGLYVGFLKEIATTMMMGRSCLIWTRFSYRWMILMK